MSMLRYNATLLALGTTLLCVLTGCGMRVPPIGEIWEESPAIDSLALEVKIKEKIFCELNAAVSRINSDPNNLIEIVDTRLGRQTKSANIYRKPVPETWGATLTLTLTVEEAANLNPSVSLREALRPKDTYLPGGITVPGPQSFSLGLAGTLSSNVTRFDKYTFFYKVKDLEIFTDACAASGGGGEPAPINADGSSMLLISKLGIEAWLKKMGAMRTSIGVSDKNQQQVYTYDVKFNILSSGSISPVWQLTPVATQFSGLPLISIKRERTHEMLLTIGPLSDSKDQPSTLASNDALAAQIGAAVGAAVRSAINQ